MSAAFTPGPWVYRALKDGWGVYPATPKNAEPICGGECDYDPLWLQEPSEANARLIAAAPDLFEACRLFVEYDANDQDDGIAMMLAYNRALEAAKAALAKARGES